MLNSILHSHKLIKKLIIQKICLGIKTNTYQVYEMILNEYNSLIQRIIIIVLMVITLEILNNLKIFYFISKIYIY